MWIASKIPNIYQPWLMPNMIIYIYKKELSCVLSLWRKKALQVAVQAMQYVLQSRQDIFIDTGFKCSVTVENKSTTYICHGNRLII